MTETDIWLYLVAAFGVGVGLGWWLFAGTAPPRDGSASQARDRARTPDPEPASDHTAAIEALQASLAAARTELDVARTAADTAEQARALATREAEAGRGRLDTLQAHLDQTREARDTLKDEVERARRAIEQLERASEEPPPTASLSFSAPSEPEDAPSSPLAPVVVTPPRVEVSSAPRPRGPIDVLFGPLGGVPLTTSARSIPWELTVRLREGEDAPDRLSDVQVTLRFDLEDEGIAVNGRRRGPLTLSRGGSVTPSRPLHVQVSLSTGYHSDTPESDRPPAIPGEHRVVIVIQYLTDSTRSAPQSARFAARIPVSAPTS